MKQHIRTLIANAVRSLIERGELGIESVPEVQLDVPRNPQHGDFSSNIAMVIAKAGHVPPRELAERIAGAIPRSERVRSCTVAGPGFINVTLEAAAFMQVIPVVLAQGAAYGRTTRGAGKHVQVEFVSANPTGPLHIGHGRGAAYGAAIANLLEAQGYDVCREYYVNDAGRQMDILALSIWLRYLQSRGHAVTLPDNAYQGDYVVDIASAMSEACADQFEVAVVPAPMAADPETLLDEWIAQCKSVLGAPVYDRLFQFGCEYILEWIRADLSAFGVEYDVWFSERSLARDGLIDRVLRALRERSWVYEKDGALWFMATHFGDEKDRVLVRENGNQTYFAADVAYHADKYARGFAQLINVWGADHHGYVPRIKAALAALGHDPQCLEVLLVQFASLYRGAEKIPMSTRAGEFVTLSELIEEVGRDAARYFYVTRRSDQHLDFDLELAKSQSSDNPVYYVQYAHARICSVLRQLELRGLVFAATGAADVVGVLTEAQERALASSLSRYPEVVAAAAAQREPHQLATYLRELANEFHVYYNTHKLLVEDPRLRDARLALAVAIRTVIGNGLGLLGVSAPQEM